MPAVGRKAMLLFCADHGVVEEGVSPVSAGSDAPDGREFSSRRRGHYRVVPPIWDRAGDRRHGRRQTDAQFHARAGHVASGGRARDRGRHGSTPPMGIVLGAGEMGIGNSTAAAALLCAFTGIDPREAAGRGTGLDDAGVARKADVIARALALHRPDPSGSTGSAGRSRRLRDRGDRGPDPGCGSKTARRGFGRIHLLLGRAGGSRDGARGARLRGLLAPLG